MIKIAERFAGTVIYDILTAVDALYADIDADQKNWKTKAPAHCPDGCGSCCAHFEPEIYEAEALYLAAWMLENQPERADRIVEDSEAGTNDDSCILFDPDSPYHCTVYGGRCLICRLFGFSGDHGKDGRIRWKPCRYMHATAGQSALQPGRQYDEDEMLQLFGATPPFIGSAPALLLALNPDDIHPRPLRRALPDAIKKLKMLLRFLTPPEPDCPSPHPIHPLSA